MSNVELKKIAEEIRINCSKKNKNSLNVCKQIKHVFLNNTLINLELLNRLLTESFRPRYKDIMDSETKYKFLDFKNNSHLEELHQVHQDVNIYRRLDQKHIIEMTDLLERYKKAVVGLYFVLKSEKMIEFDDIELSEEKFDIDNENDIEKITTRICHYFEKKSRK